MSIHNEIGDTYSFLIPKVLHLYAKSKSSNFARGSSRIRYRTDLNSPRVSSDFEYLFN